jgi:hypothetical protein
MRVFRTDIFRPIAEHTQIGFGRGPRCCEDAFVLDCELELQSLAVIVWVGCPRLSNGVLAGTEILFSATLVRFPRGFVIDQPIAFPPRAALG